MSLRLRIMLFIAVLCADAALIRVQPWSMIVGCAAYLVLVLPKVNR